MQIISDISNTSDMLLLLVVIREDNNYDHILSIYYLEYQKKGREAFSIREYGIVKKVNSFVGLPGLLNLETSPPSARVAAMRSMQNKLHNKTSLNFLETHLTLSLNTL